MDDGRVEIYNGRLLASRQELIAFLDAREDICHPAPDIGWGVHGISVSHGVAPDAAQEFIRTHEAPAPAGIIHIITLWDGDYWLKYGHYMCGDSPFFRIEFYGGHVKIMPAKKDGTTVDVSIVSGWPTLRPYWEWLARRLVCRFAEIPRRGRPRGSGVFRNRADFESNIGNIVHKLPRPTQEDVTEYMRHHGWGRVDVRQLRRWCKQFGYNTWEDLLNTL